MKTRTLFTISILVLAVLIITGSCATKPKTQKESVSQEEFFKAISLGNVAEVKRLIEAGADVNARDNKGQTALIYAVRWWQVEVVKILVEEGADVNAKSETLEETALIAVAAMGIDRFAEIAEILIEAGADVNAQDANGYTALMYATDWRLTKIPEVLKEAGAK